MAESPQLSASDLSPPKYSLSSQSQDPDHLKSSLREAEYRLVQSKEIAALKDQQLEDAREELERSHKEVDRQAKVIFSQNQQLTDVKARLEEAQRARKFEGEEAQPLAFQTQIRERDEEIGRLRELLKGKEESLESAVARHDIVRSKMQDFGAENQHKDSEIAGLRKQLAHLQRTADNAILSRKGEGPLMVQVEHLKSDNERLIKLLKSTKEFRDFSEFAGSMTGAVAVAPPADEDDWVPLDAFSLAHEFFGQQDGELTERKVNLLLAKLNGIWREREKAQIARIKMNCAREVEDLRRQLSMRDPSSQVKAETDIQRLHGDLKLAYKHMRENISGNAGSQRAAARPASASTQQVSELKRQVKSLTHQVQTLKATKPATEEVNTNGDFFDGASWIAQWLQKEALKLQEAISPRIAELLRGLQDCQMPLTSRRQQEKLMVNSTQEAVESKVRDYKTVVDAAVHKTLVQQRLT